MRLGRAAERIQLLRQQLWAKEEDKIAMHGGLGALEGHIRPCNCWGCGDDDGLGKPFVPGLFRSPPGLVAARSSA